MGDIKSIMPDESFALVTGTHHVVLSEDKQRV